jgi:hypothetical protein
VEPADIIKESDLDKMLMLLFQIAIEALPLATIKSPDFKHLEAVSSSKLEKYIKTMTGQTGILRNETKQSFMHLNG